MKGALAGIITGWFLLAGTIHPCIAASYTCQDVVCLITSITQANANGQANTIQLAPGTYTLTTPATMATGLPVVTSTLTITGAGPAQTIITRSTAPETGVFRLVEVGSVGRLTLQGLTLANGFSGPRAGGGVLNRGNLVLAGVTVQGNHNNADGGGIAQTAGSTTITDSVIAQNLAQIGGGGVDVTGGTVTILRSTLRNNTSQGGGAAVEVGGFATAGAVSITQSAITDNASETGAALVNWSRMTLVNSTVGRNKAIGPFADALALLNISGTLAITNSTITENRTTFTLQPQAAVHNAGGVVTLSNTILSGNTQDCGGELTSLDANIWGVGCEVLFLPDDQRTDNPGLATFVDDGIPSHGHYPLLATSPAVNAAHDLEAPDTDQLGQPQIGTRDIGSVEFVPPQIAKAKKVKRVARRD
jgi:hypothetical protein